MQVTPQIPEQGPLFELDAFEEYRRMRSPDAFERLVRQYADLVYASALRQLRDGHRAEDATQVVFTVLALKAHQLRAGTLLAPWLLKVTQYTALDARRRQQRRQRHELIAQQVRDEQRASQMNSDSTISIDSDASDGQDLMRTVLDEGIAKLSKSERAAVVLRYFQDKSHLDVASALGIGEEAARKRVQRGLEKLRAFFADRGAIAPSLSASGVASAISAHALTSAPQSLVARVASAVAPLTASSVPPTLSSQAFVHSAKGVITLMAWTQIKLSLIATLLLLVLAGGGALAVHAWSSHSRDESVTILPATPPASAPATAPAAGANDYALAPGEVLKRIAKPDRSARERIWPFLRGNHPTSMIVELADKPELARQTWGGGQALDGMLNGIAGLLSFDFSAPRDLFRLELPGDWIVRRGASTDERMAALETLLQTQGKRIHFEKRHVPREIVIARGSFHFQALADTKWSRGVNIYADKLGPNGRGGGSGDVAMFLKDLGDQLNRRVMNQADPSREPFSWTYHDSGDLRLAAPGTELQRKLDQVLANVSLQTGLTFQKTTADEDVWFVTRTAPSNLIAQ